MEKPLWTNAICPLKTKHVLDMSMHNILMSNHTTNQKMPIFLCPGLARLWEASLNNFFYKIVILFTEIGTIFNMVNLRVTSIIRCKIPSTLKEQVEESYLSWALWSTDVYVHDNFFFKVHKGWSPQEKDIPRMQACMWLPLHWRHLV